MELQKTTIEGSLDKCVMGIATSGLGQMSMMLRDQIYSNKNMAVAREFITNAVDEHITHQISRSPLIHVPSPEEPWFSVRDFAKGLAKEDVFNVFFQYFTSTKKNDKKTGGFFGLGSKVWAAISQTVVVTSWHEGIKSVYAGVIIDSHSEGHLNSQDPSDEESGIEVLINLPENKIYNFNSNFYEFYKAYRHYHNLEVVNLLAEQVESEFVKRIYNGYLVQGDKVYGQNDKVLYKGVVYSLPWTLDENGYRTSSVFKIEDHVSLDLHPSRERLQESEKNKDVIGVLFEAAKNKTVADFESKIPSDFFERWVFCCEHKNYIIFLRNRGAKHIQKIPDEIVIGSKNDFWFYSKQNGKLKRRKDKWSGESSVSILSSNSTKRIHFISQTVIGSGIERTLDALFGGSYTIACPRKDVEPSTFADLQAICESVGEGYSNFVVDQSHLQPTKAPRIVQTKEAQVGDVRAFIFGVGNFGTGSFEKITFKYKNSNYQNNNKFYWVPISGNGDIQIKGFTSSQIMECEKFLGCKILGLNRNNRDGLPDNCISAVPILKAMRRNAHKAVDWSLNKIVCPYPFDRSNFKFLGLYRALGDEDKVTWPFKPHAKKVRTRSDVLENNEKVKKIKELAATNVTFYAYSQALKNSSDFAGQIEDAMLELIRSDS
jgi:hypothetical protein